jgi:hypothetical protein
MHALTDSEYTTGSLHLASFLLYVLGKDAHVSTYRLGEGTHADFRFTFTDSADQCSNLKADFFSQEGASVTNGRGLLLSLQEIKRTVRLADNSSDGLWVRSNADGNVA